MKEKTAVVSDQKGWLLENNDTSLFITRCGAHMAPVEFALRSAQPIRPYYISPWQNENLELEEPVLVPLRGDFFCMPFGEGNQYEGESHAVHGECAGSLWNFEDCQHQDDLQVLHLSLTTQARPGRIDKRLFLKDGHMAVYSQEKVSGFAGKTTLGHHATLHGQQSWLLSTSPLQFGMVSPGGKIYANAEYGALLPGARFTSLAQVPTIWKTPPLSDCSIFPARQGFVDILQVFFVQSQQPVWTCAVNHEKGYLWYSLKDSTVLLSMVMWMENQGRHGAPWNSRNCCIGLEDVCAFMALGLAASVAPNPANLAGIATCRQMDGSTPFDINYIQGVAPIPPNFGRVADVRFGPNAVTFVDENRAEVTSAVCHEFIFTGACD